MNRRPNVKAMLAARAYFQKNPAGTIPTGLWSDPEWSKDRFDRFIRQGIENRINSRDPRYPAKGRRTTEAHEIALLRLRPFIGNRIAIDYIDPVLGARVLQAMAHRVGARFGESN